MIFQDDLSLSIDYLLYISVIQRYYMYNIIHLYFFKVFYTVFCTLSSTFSRDFPQLGTLNKASSTVPSYQRSS